MSEAITLDRSPRSPGLELVDSINLTSKLFDAIRTATVAPDIAVRPLGYGGTNGAAMGTLATLAQYGLVDRAGGKVSVTPLAIRIIHSKGDEQREAAIREAALFPKIMKELYDGYLDCAESVITGHLIQSGFNPERAKRVASIHVANKVFAKLCPSEQQAQEDNDADVSGDKKETPLTSGGPAISSIRQTPPPAAPLPVAVGTKNMLATYTAPLGANEATITFCGDKLSVEDFDALGDFVEYCKKQYERKLKSELAAAKAAYPFVAMWKNKDFDKMVKIVGEMGEKDGVKYYQSEDGTGIPASEIFNAAK